jgi:hypothetical protein
MMNETGTAVGARREERIRRALDHLRRGTTDQFAWTSERANTPIRRWLSASEN